MPASDAQLLALTRGYGQTLDVLAARTAEQVGTLWDAYGGVDDASARTFSSSAAATVEVAQRQAAGLTVSYLSNYISLATDERFDPELDLDELVDNVRPVPAIEVYARPVVTARAAIAAGKTFAEARAIARARATATADTDVMLASRSASNRTFGRAPERVVGYRRVPRASGACTFCLMASTQRYHRGDLLPLHVRCHCKTQPIVGTRDPGHVIERELLRELKARQRAAKTKPALAVREHGELGPVLVDARHKFTGADRFAA